ncbi:MAG TPA: TRAP transporter substrate-binding protein [Anaerohalosphaeraceae bacterium]|jgi:tripartite ATP-independent transporter DctP family solute receptor|nr:TRAP transporter substrate-binding protein [Anaerohalosphaeraceae bacterium]HRT51260.1 TRAP transporter substrate-binding protein [Anaerohalosphaeraceae bacterium]HRT87773.1 TRAP transporter substrate-binding protein [Anaerohalosphaeraceae bacterium]
MTKAASAASAILLVGALVGCGKRDDIKVFKLAHGLNTEHPVHKSMEFMAKRVAEKSNGRMRVDIYPSEQLGPEKVCLESLQFGALAMTKTSSSPMEGFVEEMKVLGLPYVFRDKDHYWKVLNGPIGKELLAAGRAKGLMGLCFYDAGARSFYTTTKAINSPDDLVGQNIRVQKSPVAMDMVKVLGGKPTPIDYGELYTALQQGVVDGAENNPPSLYTSRHYEICKYYCLDEHTMPPDVLLISPMIWDKMTADEQRILQEAADESVEFQRKLWEEFEAQSMKEIATKVEIVKPDKELFRSSVRPLWDSFAGTRVGELINRIVEVQ